MIISIEDSLDKIKRELKERGHVIYNFSDKVESEAYIYSGAKQDLLSSLSKMNVKNNTALIINADKKDMNELDYIIEHRAYSGIF